MKIDLNKHIWEGWLITDFIEALEPTLIIIQEGRSYIAPFKNKTELKKWCMDNQPYYKKHIPEVVVYFSKKFNIK